MPIHVNRQISHILLTSRKCMNENGNGDWERRHFLGVLGLFGLWSLSFTSCMFLGMGTGHLAKFAGQSEG